LAAVAYVLARRDLKRMDAGQIDPIGTKETAEAKDIALLALIFAVPLGVISWISV